MGRVAWMGRKAMWEGRSLDLLRFLKRQFWYGPFHGRKPTEEEFKQLVEQWQKKRAKAEQEGRAGYVKEFGH